MPFSRRIIANPNNPEAVRAWRAASEIAITADRYAEGVQYWNHRFDQCRRVYFATLGNYFSLRNELDETRRLATNNGLWAFAAFALIAVDKWSVLLGSLQ
jgi:hypothetical protein